jgi:hypothetical protein
VRRVSAGHYQVEAHGFHYDVVKKELPVVTWIVLKNGEREDFPSSGRYGQAKDLVYADIEKEGAKKGENVTDPNMAVQHLDTTGTDRPTGNASGPANTPLDLMETATPEPDLGSQAVMGEEESVEVVDDDPSLDEDEDGESEEDDDENVENDD